MTEMQPESNHPCDIAAIPYVKGTPRVTEKTEARRVAWLAAPYQL
jgi:hypothetical protein